MPRFCLVTVFALTLLSQAAVSRLQAQETSSTHLKGLTGIAVHVDTDGAPSVSMNQLETTLEQRLLQAGITVVPNQAPRTYGKRGNLWANVIVIRPPGNDLCVLNIRLRVYGSVVLAGSNQRGEAITWETERHVTFPASEIDARLRENLNFLIDNFSRAYLSANPKA
jgi:hypothetical protein